MMSSGAAFEPSSGSSTKHAAYPRRNLDQLYCQSITYLCAIGALPLPRPDKIRGDAAKVGAPPPRTTTTTTKAARPCIPCAYKICNFDISLDSDFSKRIPNQRPDQCPRSHSASNPRDDINGDDEFRGTMGYHRGMNVLTVGDGDFTFSLAVTRLVVGDSNSSNDHNANKGMVVATSYEDSKTLRKVYPDFDSTYDKLLCQGGNNLVLAYNVDATRLDETLPELLRQRAPTNNNKGLKFHRICWNL